MLDIFDVGHFLCWAFFMLGIFDVGHFYVGHFHQIAAGGLGIWGSGSDEIVNSLNRETIFLV